MTSARVLARVFARIGQLTLAAATVCAVTAQAQNMPWPGDAQPQAPASAPWPSQQPPGSAAPATLPMPGMQSAPMSMAPPAPSAEQQKCVQEFNVYRGEAEKRARAAQAEAQKKPTRERMCELVTAYSNAEANWIKFSEKNLTRCGIPQQAVAQIKAVHVHTADAKKKLCAAGPQQAGPIAPSLSDALGTGVTPATEETKKRRVGGTMDTLTGNALTR